MKKTLLSAFALMLLLNACKKVDTPDSYEDMLRGGQWKRTALTETYRQGTGAMKTDDVYANTLSDCIKDNTLEFKDAFVGTERKNTLKCNAGDPDQTQFDWEIYNSGKNIRIYNVPETFSGESSINADIVTLTANQLSIRYMLFNQNPLTQHTDTFTFMDTFRK